MLPFAGFVLMQKKITYRYADCFHACILSFLYADGNYFVGGGGKGAGQGLRFDPEGEEEFAIELNPLLGGGGQLSHKNVSANIRLHIQNASKSKKLHIQRDITYLHPLNTCMHTNCLWTRQNWRAQFLKLCHAYIYVHRSILFVTKY
jgi:hypothetical protein